MGGRGSASSPIVWNWEGEYDFGAGKKLINKNPIGEENKVLYKDTLNNLTSVFPIIDLKDTQPVTVKGAAGVAVVSVDILPGESKDTMILKGDLQLGFDEKIFATHYSLVEMIDDNFSTSFISTKKENHIVVHELAHMVDYQLSIKKNANMSLKEFLEPKIVLKKHALLEQKKMMDFFKGNKRFSAGFADSIRKELHQDPNTILNQVSNYAKSNEAEFFAESFAKWYLSEDKNGQFEKAFEKVLKEKIKEVS